MNKINENGTSRILSMGSMNNQNGAIAILTAILLLVFVGFVALSVDTGNLVAAKNELQNAADAAALAGAAELYINEGQSVNPEANKIAYETAMENFSANTQVEVNVQGDWVDNLGDIQRGHWSFGRGMDLDTDEKLPRDFYLPDPLDTLSPTDLFGVSIGELDNNRNFINAVQVTVRRKDTPIKTFFGKILGKDSFEMSATAVAYIGFAGSFAPFEINAPLAICYESITNDEDEYLCNIGRVIPSGSGTNFNNPQETGGWTDYEQTEDGECTGNNNSGGISNTSFEDAIDAGGNESMLVGGNFDTGNGAKTAGYKKFREQWLEETNNGTKPWTRKLPVISCPDGSIGNCSLLVGGVDVDILWITEQGGGGMTSPTAMESNFTDMEGNPIEDWSGSDIADAEKRFWDFAAHFGLPTVPDAEKENQQVNGGEPYTPLNPKTVYFYPSCKAAEPSGGPNGKNLGMLAKWPVLVD